MLLCEATQVPESKRRWLHHLPVLLGEVAEICLQLMLNITTRLLKGPQRVTTPLAPAVSGGVTVGRQVRKPAAFMSVAMCLFGQRGGAGLGGCEICSCRGNSTRRPGPQRQPVPAGFRVLQG